MLNEPSRRRVVRALWRAIWQDKTRTLAALTLLLFAKLSGVAVPLLLKGVIDRFSRPDSMAEALAPGAAPVGVQAALVLPVFLLLGYALLRFVGALFTELRDLVFAPVSQRCVTAFAERSFAHLMAIGPRFHSQRSTGVLIRNVERGTGGIAFLLGAGLFTVVPTLVEFAGVVVVMAAGYSFAFTAVIMLTFFVYAGVTMALTRTRALRQRRVNEMDSRAHGRMVDSLLNYETVKAYAREDHERARYAAVLAAWVEGSLGNQRALSLLHVAQSAVIALGVAGVMLLAAEQTVRGTMSVGDLVLVNAYVIQVCLPLNALGFVFRETKDALVDTEALFDLLDQPSDLPDTSPLPPLDVHAGAVAFEDVAFSYEPGRQILYDVSLEIAPGQTVAVVGGSGSGKSTLARLLLRLYDVDGGRITIDGQDLRSVQTASLRKAIGVVPQDTVLFNDSIARNIAYGRLGAGMADIVEAARAAQVHEFVASLPRQYDTMVGERGLALSGGEKQRIAIARVFLKNPPLMVFDEATSALDTRAERAIQGELARIARGRSTLVVAHRLSTVVNADQIIVMDKGRIIERGRHEALLARNGLYAQLWNLQRQQRQFEHLERRLARRPIDLAALVASVVQGLRASIGARSLRLHEDIGMTDTRISGDPSALAHVLWEIGAHALAATPDGGRITLRLYRVSANVRLVLTDGRSEDLPAQAQWPGETELVPIDPVTLRAAVERQGGHLRIEPASAARGMRFSIDLPLHSLATDTTPLDLQPHSAPANTAAAVMLAGNDSAAMPPTARALRDLHVMVIEDGLDAREALQMLLEFEGATVQAHASGQEALKWLEREPAARWPQVLICDIGLGDTDGSAVLQQVRRIESGRGAAPKLRLPAIALTGLDSEQDRAAALQAGFDAHLVKPVAPHLLIAQVRALSPTA